jgi:TolB-like protein
METATQFSDMENQVLSKTICLAILPFENFTPGNDQAYFARGFVEDLLTDLSRFQSLMIISSHSTLGHLDGDKPIDTEKLGADYLLKGNFRYRNEQVRIVVQLIEANTRHIIWAERYDAPLETIFEIHDDIIERVVGALSVQIDQNVLTQAKQKSITQLEAYDYWLKGVESMKQVARDSDEKARTYFQKALNIDPHYARAYTGISLTYFNNWSCALWDDWDTNETQAFEYAVKAVALDENDHVSQMVMGRILLYRQNFEQAEYHLNRSLALNSNDADNLVQLCLCFSQLGNPDLAIKLFRKALRLNPYHESWYYAFSAMPYLVGQRYLESIGFGSKAPSYIAVDLPAILAICYAYLGDEKAAQRYLSNFLKLFQEKIKHGEACTPLEAFEWMIKVNPFKNPEDTAHIVKGMELAGIKNASKALADGYEPKMISATMPFQNVFRKENDLWEIAFLGQSVVLPEIKGFHDLLQLLLRQGEEIHCSELMGVTSTSNEEVAFDQEAKNNYKKRIQALQEDLAEAESLQYYEKAEKISCELDQLIEHVTQATGMGGRTRKLNSNVERSRAAVTLRIRSAIKKIGQAQPDLGKHLKNAIKTGTFCSYQPEHEMNWVL